MSFYLVQINDDGTETPVSKYGPFKTGPMAARWAKKLERETGKKVLGRRMKHAPDWRARQQQRLDSGELKPLPATWDLPPIDGHFLHLAADDEEMVSFFAKAEHAVLDKATVMTPTQYLARFYRQIGQEEMMRYARMVDHGNEVFFAKTEDEIEKVYESCDATSCMTTWYQRNKAKRDYFWSPFHPTRVYAAGDLAIAYTLSKSGKPAERCICWPDKKLHGRIYSDNSGRLKRRMEMMGWREGDAHAFAGARLLRHVVKHGGVDHFVVPYVDNDTEHGSGATRVRDNGDFLVIDPTGPMPASNTTGLIKAVFAEKPRLEPTRFTLTITTPSGETVTHTLTEVTLPTLNEAA